MNSSLLDLVRELNTLNDDNLADRVIANNDVQWCLSELQDILEAEQPTLTPPNEWVSVEERLPEDDLPEGTNRLQIKVLVAIRAKNGYTVRTQNRIRQNQSWSNKEPFTAWYWKHSLGEVTHWMPLPAPPDRRPPEGEEDT
jgi:hypothetical protein